MRNIVVQAGLFSQPSDVQRSERALIHLLRALVRIDVDYLRRHPETPLLYRSGIRYQRETGTEEWKAIPQLLRDKVGDCEDLATYRVAELVVNGIAADVFLKKQKRGGFYLFHVMVRHPDGRIEDPSRRLGMGRES